MEEKSLFAFTVPESQESMMAELSCSGRSRKSKPEAERVKEKWLLTVKACPQ